MRREFEGTTRLQGVGVVNGIKAKNVKVGDRRVWNFGKSTEVIRVELTKTGKSVKITTLWFDSMSFYDKDKKEWIGEWKEDTRTLKVDTIVVVEELNPVEEAIEEVVVEETVAPEVEAVVETIVETVEEVEVKKAPAKKRISVFEKWLRTFIEEKGLNEDYIFEIEYNNQVHFMEFNYLIEAIINAPAAEQKQIKNTIVMIDFKNGDVMHFFNYLASAYIKNNY